LSFLKLIKIHICIDANIYTLNIQENENTYLPYSISQLMLYHAVIAPNAFSIETLISGVYIKKLYLLFFLEASYCLTSCSMTTF